MFVHFITVGCLKKMRQKDPELHARRRAEILAAAESCFARKGFHAASMQDIAAAAGVSLGLLYRYFANKEAIIGHFADLDRAALVAAIAAWGESRQPRLDLDRLVTGLLGEASDPNHAALVTEIYAEAMRNDSLRDILAGHEREVSRAWARALASQEKASGVRLREKPELMAELIMAMIDGLATRFLLLGRQQRARKEAALGNALATLIGLD